MSRPGAHITEDGRKYWLHDHLRGTVEPAAKFADGFGCGEWEYLAEMWHDLGKWYNGIKP